jgi:hypothetical protein
MPKIDMPDARIDAQYKEPHHKTSAERRSWKFEQMPEVNEQLDRQTNGAHRTERVK